MNAEDKLKLSGLYGARPSGEVVSFWFGKERIIRLTQKPNGYLKFNASTPGELFTVHAHRFVWTALVGPIPPGYTVNHKNFCKTDNRIENLELMTLKNNVRHAARGGRLSKPKNKGEANIRAKLTNKQVLEIFERAKSERVTNLAREFGMGATAIRDIKHKRKWGHLWAEKEVEIRG